MTDKHQDYRLIFGPGDLSKQLEASVQRMLGRCRAQERTHGAFGAVVTDLFAQCGSGVFETVDGKTRELTHEECRTREIIPTTTAKDEGDKGLMDWRGRLGEAGDTLAGTACGLEWRCDPGDGWVHVEPDDRLEVGDEVRGWTSCDGQLEMHWEPVHGFTISTIRPPHWQVRRRLRVVESAYGTLGPTDPATRAHIFAQPDAFAIQSRRRNPLDLCGCGEHAIPEGADRYAEHRKWVARARWVEGAEVSTIGAEPRTEPVVLAEIMHEDFV